MERKMPQQNTKRENEMNIEYRVPKGMGWDKVLVPWDFLIFFPKERTSFFLLKHEFKILYTSLSSTKRRSFPVFLYYFS
jgi:hypothetical protein